MPVEAAQRAEALRLLGGITAGIAHDVRNVLNGLSLRVQFLERARGTSSALSATFAEMRGDINVGLELLERICGFARGAASSTAPVDLNLVLQEACELATLHVAGGNSSPINVRRDTKRRPVVVMGHRCELVSAVLNLILNAAEAAGPDGHITARAGSTDGSGWIEVSDDGPGVPPEVEARMFERFFTTKEQGTGLGLSAVAECMEQHGGEVHVCTSLGRGTTIALWFAPRRTTRGATFDTLGGYGGADPAAAGPARGAADEDGGLRETEESGRTQRARRCAQRPHGRRETCAS